MKAHFLLVLVSLALAAAKDLPSEEQASQNHQSSPNIIERSLANRPQYWGHREGSAYDDSKGGYNNEDEDDAGVEIQDPEPEPALTRDPSYEDTTVAPPTSTATADAQVEDPAESESTEEESSTSDGRPWPADTYATTLYSTSTSNADAKDPPASKPTQRDYCYQSPPNHEDESTTTMTSTTTLTHFITVSRPRSSGPSREPSPASSGVLNREEPVALAERPPGAGHSNPMRIAPIGTESIDPSIPHQTGPGGQYEESPFKSATSLLPWWATNGPSGLGPPGPWNRTIPSAAAPRKTTADEDEEPWPGRPTLNKTPWESDREDSVEPPAEGDYPEGPKIEPLDPPASSPTTGPEASQTGQVEGTSGTGRWMPDILFVGGVFVLMALLGEL